MAWTQADVDALKSALKGGARSVSYADKTVTYHSIDDMLKLLQAMEADVLNAATPNDSDGRSTYASHSRD